MLGFQPYGRAGVLERRALAFSHPIAFGSDRRRLRVGLVNNMPDAALAATERQFRTLVEAAAPERRVELLLFHIPEIARSPAAAARLRARYRHVGAVQSEALDALIVTGAEPRASDLRAEPFWPALTRLVDWADGAGLPTLWSCLAAHAAVLHLDGIGRRPLAEKCSGLFTCEPATRDRLLADLAPVWITPHSRGNTLEEAELVRHGYRILSRSPQAGVDAFARRSSGGLFLFLQGHPEYDEHSLALEFKRDLQRFVDGVRPSPPALPQNVFGPVTARRLESVVEAARGDRRSELMACWPRQDEIVLAENTWRAPAVRLYRNWLASSHEAAGDPAAPRPNMRLLG